MAAAAPPGGHAPKTEIKETPRTSASPSGVGGSSEGQPKAGGDGSAGNVGGGQQQATTTPPPAAAAAAAATGGTQAGSSLSPQKGGGCVFPVRILFLHSLEPAGDRSKVRLLEEAFGKDRVTSPSLGMKRTMTAFSLAFAFVILLMVAAVVLTFLKSNIAAGVVVLLSSAMMALIAFFLAGRGVTHLMLRRAVARAEAAFKSTRPNIIVAPAFGAVVALQMDCFKLPLVLLSPAQDQYYRYMHFRPLVSLSDYPYTIIVHGSGDARVPLDDSIRLVETCELGRCRLEVVDDDHSLKTLNKEDFRNWVEEAFEKGQEVVKSQVAKGANKAFDISLFEDPTPVGGGGLEGGVSFSTFNV